MRRSIPRLSEFSSRDNSFGMLRLVLASAVIISHSYPLSGQPGREFVSRFSGQETLGGLAVAGFFVLSGFLLTRSALNGSIGRYAWRRALRIFPGFWVCLLVTAFVFAPLMWLYERGLTSGFVLDPQGPLSYLRANALTGMQQWGISGLLMETPWGVETGTSVFDGSLSTLIYEVTCYVVLGVLALVVLKRAPRIAAVTIVATLYLGIVLLWLEPTWNRGIALPLVGGIHARWLVSLGFCFALGGLFQLVKSSIPIHDGLGIASAATLIGSLYFGGYPLIGPIALTYLLIWLALRLPEATRHIGRETDYSYGISSMPSRFSRCSPRSVPPACGYPSIGRLPSC